MRFIKDLIKQNKLLMKIYRFYYRLVATILWNIRFFLNRILGLKNTYACCFVFTTLLGRVKKNNWGDDLNQYLFCLLTQKKIKFVPFEQLIFCPHIERYSLIGSIIGDFDLDNTIVYGSGAITSNPKLRGTPKKVLSVRGPLSRQVLLNHGIECPPVYGDPALLLPLIYKPEVKVSNKIAIIPHYRTLESNWMENDWIVSLEKNYELIVIDLSKYEKWTDIVDSIRSCKVILSESLHGLIVAESYRVPSVWIELIPHNMEWEWDFKFLDFYSSIGKENPKCYRVYEESSVEKILQKAKEWTPGTIDYDSMLKAFPFKLKGI